MATNVGRRIGATKARDDSTLQELHSTSSGVRPNGVLVIKLQAICRKAEALLDEINTTLTNTSEDFRVKNIPIFEDEKKKLLSIQAALDKQYSQGLLINQNYYVIVQVRLCDSTEFPIWNYLAAELNTAADELDGVDHSSSDSAGKEKSNDANSLLRRFGRTMVLVVTFMLLVVILVEYVLSMQRLYDEFQAEIQVSSTAHFDAVHEAADNTPVLINWMSSNDPNGWSAQLDSEWDNFATRVGGFKKHLHVLKVDCSQTANVCEREQIIVGNYPTLQLFRGSKLEVDFGAIQDDSALMCAKRLLSGNIKHIGKSEQTVDVYLSCLETSGASILKNSSTDEVKLKMLKIKSKKIKQKQFQDLPAGHGNKQQQQEKDSIVDKAAVKPVVPSEEEDLVAFKDAAAADDLILKHRKSRKGVHGLGGSGGSGKQGHLRSKGHGQGHGGDVVGLGGGGGKHRKMKFGTLVN